MADRVISTKIQQRNDTAQNWANANPILLSGEIGVESDTLKFKIGNGANTWNSLSYVGQVFGTSTTGGIVKLSDATTSTSGVDGGIAATPLAVKNAVATEATNRSNADSGLQTQINNKLSLDGNNTQTTTDFTESNSLEELASGSTLGTLFGKLAKAVTLLISHISSVANPHSVTKSQVGLGNVDNVKQYSASNVPPYPVTSVNGSTGAVSITNITGNAATATKATQDASGNVITTTYAKKTEIPSVPVTSVNTKTGAVVLSASDVNALPNTTEYVSSVNGSSGDITITVPTKTSDLTNDSKYLSVTQTSPTSGQAVIYNGSAWVNQTIETGGGTVNSVDGNTPDSNGAVNCIILDDGATPSSIPVNADTLNGSPASYYATTEQLGTKVSKSGDTIEGSLTLQQNGAEERPIIFLLPDGSRYTLYISGNGASTGTLSCYYHSADETANAAIFRTNPAGYVYAGTNITGVATGMYRNIEVRITSASGTQKSTGKIVMVRK